MKGCGKTMNHNWRKRGGSSCSVHLLFERHAVPLARRRCRELVRAVDFALRNFALQNSLGDFGLVLFPGHAGAEKETEEE